MRSISWSRAALVTALAAISLGVAPPRAEAQYFGRNHVQYRTFDFQVLRTEHFDVYFYPEEEVAARDGARMAERWYTRLSTMLDHQFEERQPLVFYGSHPAFQQTTTLGGEVGEGTGGATEPLQQRVVMPLTGSYQETDHVLGHELVHAFQYDISGLGRALGNVSAQARSFASAPLWFVEGMAEYLSLGPVDPNTAMWVRDAALAGEVPTIEEMTRDPRVFPYRWGQAFWAYVAGRWGDAAIGQILRMVGQGVPYEEAFPRVLNIELDELGADWEVAIRRAYLPMLEERREAREVARPLITSDRAGGTLNVGPAISPDGRWVAFLSELESLDVELWVADAQTGEVVRRLQKGAAFDPHFQSLRYINSAGSWSPDARQFVFSALRGGRDRLVFVDAVQGGRTREVAIPDVIEIATPSWSPDGRTIVFSGVTGGISDLYAYDVETGETRQLTDDRAANLHPSVSPDGRTVAFATEAGPDTNLDDLRYGGYRIALLDMESGETTTLPSTIGFGGAINPDWTRDGTGLYFISSRSGVPNVYRVEIASGELFHVTDLFGGVSGITDLSPAISSARQTDRLLFTAYEEGGYNIYSLTEPEELAGEPVTAATELVDAPVAAVLPPVPRPQEPAFNRVIAYLDDPATGLPSPSVASAWEVDDYSPRLALSYLGQPTVGVTTGGMMGQGGLYGGISAMFTDVLGYHTVFGVVQAQGEFDEIGFSTVYLNRKHRWNWGAVAERIPYIGLFRNLEVEPLDPNDPSLVLLRDQILRQRYFYSTFQGIAQYPFSTTQRIEFAAGYRRIARDVQVLEVSGPAVLQGGQILSFQPQNQDRYSLPEAEASWNMFEGSSALVYDNALFGYTSPFAGQRYRLEAATVLGSLNYLQAVADYRRYLWLRPFTLAVQGLHLGRYGEDAEETFNPIFLGQPSLVRGYWDLYRACATGNSGCERGSLDQLFGSRIGVAKAEVRFPLIRQLVVGPLPIPPIEGFAFGDAGVAWSSGMSPTFQRLGEDPAPTRDPITGDRLSDDRFIVTSVGVGARINLLGYFILEVDYVNPLDRARGWHWQFALQPGF